MIETEVPELVYSFRCNNCQSLETSDHAGERDIPLKCRTCGRGAHYIINDAGAPELISEPENWTVLADLDGDGINDVISYHGEIKIAPHTPFKTLVLKDEHGANVIDDDGTVVHVTTPREGPLVENPNPQHISVATEGHALGTGDDVIGEVNA